MKILMILWDSSGFPPDPRIEKECRSLIKAGHDITLLCCKRDGQLDREIVDGIKVCRIVLPQLYTKGLTRQLIRLGVSSHEHPYWKVVISEAVREFTPDVVHCHDLRPVETVLGLLREGVVHRVVADLHEIYPEAIKYYYSGLKGKAICVLGRWEKRERQALQEANVAITISNQAQGYYVAKYNQSPHVIRNTVDVAHFDSLCSQYQELRPDTPRILYEGSYNPKRGIDVIVKAMKYVAKETSAHLCLVGAIPKEKLSWLMDGEVQGRIQFMGWVPPQRVPSLIKTATIVVHPLLTDSPQTDFCCPHKIFEAQAAGKPLVASANSSFREYVEGTKSGVLAKSGDVMEWAQALIHLLQNPNVATNMGQNGRNAVQTKYGWHVDGENLCKLYEAL